MTDFLFPLSVPIASEVFKYIDATAAAVNPYTGVVRTASLGGDRVGATIETSALGGRGSSSGLQDRANVQAFIARLRGRQNRAYLSDAARIQRGSFPGTELMPNNTFASGTTGWSGGGSISQAVIDGVMRASRTANQSGYIALQNSSAITVTPYMPYVGRFFFNVSMGNYPDVTIRLGATSGNAEYGELGNYNAAGSGMVTFVGIPYTSSLWSALIDYATTEYLGSMDVPYASVQQCALVDGGQNLTLYSDQFDNSYWLKTAASIEVNAIAAPDGTTTADGLIDTAVNTSHFLDHGANMLTVSSSVQDICACVCAKAGTKTFLEINIVENTGVTVAQFWFNLSTGAVGGTNTGANWANLRLFMTALGNGWYRCTAVGRKTNAATAVYAQYIASNSNGTTAYLGTGATAIYLWRASLNTSGVPGIPQSTTSTSASATANGTQVPLKGLPASTNGLRLPGDWIEIITSYGSELKMVTMPLSSDASGCGTLNFGPKLRGSAGEGAAVVIGTPMGRFIYAGTDSMQYSTAPGVITDASFDFEEAVG